jgi:hypothetical protein
MSQVLQPSLKFCTYVNVMPISLIVCKQSSFLSRYKIILKSVFEKPTSGSYPMAVEPVSRVTSKTFL